eukprot:3851737-Amphidinium_carterae.1
MSAVFVYRARTLVGCRSGYNSSKMCVFSSGSSRDFMLTAMKTSPAALEFASKDLLQDSAFVLEALHAGYPDWEDVEEGAVLSLECLCQFCFGGVVQLSKTWEGRLFITATQNKPRLY